MTAQEMFQLRIARLGITENKPRNRQDVIPRPQPEIERFEHAGNGGSTSKFVPIQSTRNADGGTLADARPAASSQHWQKPVR